MREILAKTPIGPAPIAAIALLLIGAGCAGPGRAAGDAARGSSRVEIAPGDSVATFAGGCFWCVEEPFDRLDGVLEAISGYTDGDRENPTYEEVSAGRTGHAEAVLVRFDPGRVSYEELLGVFWRQIDPTDAGGQFADRGSQYRTAIYYHDDEQKRAALSSKAALEASGKFDAPIVTPVLPAKPFYRAEEYHQDYARKQPEHYKRYKYGSGRAPFLEQTWGRGSDRSPASRPAAAPAGRWSRPDDAELRRRLTPLQYEVTQRDGTERAFRNEYWDHKQPGIYVDVVSGEPLFSSRDKYDSRTGWPSFTRPLVPDHIVEHVDRKLGYPRTEVRSKHADSHLGHVFEDGPPPTGLRYCINSAALRFVAQDRLEQEGYGEFADLLRERAND